MQQVVVLNGAALPHSCSLGYSEQDYDQLPLLSIDGRGIRNLVDVALALQRAQGPLVTFMFANEREIVLSLSEGQAATIELMRDFGIPAPWSPDVAAGWHSGSVLNFVSCLCGVGFGTQIAHVRAALQLQRAAAGSAEA
jgi:hypothetical protein